MCAQPDACLLACSPPSSTRRPARPEKGSAEAAAAAEQRAAAAAAAAAAVTRIELYGSAEACAIAKRMIGELFDKAAEAKKDQHAAQRDREKERKAENRRLYHLRHMRDYEVRWLRRVSATCVCLAFRVLTPRRALRAAAGRAAGHQEGRPEEGVPQGARRGAVCGRSAAQLRGVATDACVLALCDPRSWRSSGTRTSTRRGRSAMRRRSTSSCCKRCALGCTQCCTLPRRVLSARMHRQAYNALMNSDEEATVEALTHH